MKLYELTSRYNEILERDDLDEETLKNALDDTSDEIGDKAENMAKLIRSVEAEIEAFKSEKDRLQARINTLTNKKCSLKGYLEVQMKISNINKIKGTLFTISLQNNPPCVKINGTIPDKYYVEQPSLLAKAQLLKDLKQGIKVENATLEQTKSLRIR